MLFNRLAVSFAFLTASVAIDVSTPLSCHPKDQISGPAVPVLSATTSATPHGSNGQGSVRAQATRCPRIKPTVTITSTVTSEVLTVPTSPGFTPILSETYSVSLHPNRRRQLPSPGPDAMAVSLDPQRQVVTSANKLPQSMICEPAATSSSSLLSVPTNCPALSTVTTTTTAVAASSTIYNACASNNLVNQGFGKGAGHGINELTFRNVTWNTGLDVTTAYDCCVACQMLGCAYGGFLINRRNPSDPFCGLYFQDVCEPKEWLGNTFLYKPDFLGALQPELGFTVFNGPCGQIVYGGSSACKDPPCMSSQMVEWSEHRVFNFALTVSQLNLIIDPRRLLQILEVGRDARTKYLGKNDATTQMLQRMADKLTSTRNLVREECDEQERAARNDYNIHRANLHIWAIISGRLRDARNHDRRDGIEPLPTFLLEPATSLADGFEDLANHTRCNRPMPRR
ncbi:MAG: hypothetical protein Q9216_004444 [Gyalolechia sp. 2 TL-2023]